jgi:hypothetical protein
MPIVDLDFVPPPMPALHRELKDFIDYTNSSEAAVSQLGESTVNRKKIVSVVASEPQPTRQKDAGKFDRTPSERNLLINTATAATPVGRALETFNLVASKFSLQVVEDYAAARIFVEHLPKDHIARFAARGGSARGWKQTPNIFQSTTSASNPLSNAATSVHRFLHPPAENRHWCVTPGWQGFLKLHQQMKRPPPTVELQPDTLTTTGCDVSKLSREEFLELAAASMHESLIDVCDVLLQSFGFANDKHELLLNFYEVELQKKKNVQSMNEVLGPVVEETGDESESQSGSHSRKSSQSVDTSHSRATSEVSSRAMSVHRQQQSIVHGLKHHRYLIKRDEHCWISLKGVVFAMHLDTPLKGPDSEGRRLYYKLYLAPVYSGRDCTTAFGSFPHQYDKDDFPNVAREKSVSSRNEEARRAQSKEQVDRVFRLFCQDFTIVGPLVDGERYWNQYSH